MFVYLYTNWNNLLTIKIDKQICKQHVYVLIDLWLGILMEQN